MTGLVVDSSAVGPMVLFDEAEDLLPGLVDRFIAGQVVVPMHWHLEVASMMQNAVRRKRLSAENAAIALESLSVMRVAIDNETSVFAWRETTRLAHRHGLTVYDAAYLELACRLTLPVATDDGDLADACRAESVELFGR